jgi:hypothetical protein
MTREKFHSEIQRIVAGLAALGASASARRAAEKGFKSAEKMATAATDAERLQALPLLAAIGQRLIHGGANPAAAHVLMHDARRLVAAYLGHGGRLVPQRPSVEPADIRSIASLIGDESIQLDQKYLILWIRAFIPKNIPGYTVKLTAGPYKGKTAIPGPLPTLGGFLTDQRGFSNKVRASNRVQSLAVFRLNPPAGPVNVVMFRHTSSGTVEVDVATGAVLGSAMADISRCSWTMPAGNSANFTIDVVGQANNPLVPGSPDIDYAMHYDITPRSPGTGFVAWSGYVDGFPDFESYIWRGGSPVSTLFNHPHPVGNTPWNLPFGANQPENGSTLF